jgi:hypothetical protein
MNQKRRNNPFKHEFINLISGLLIASIFFVLFLTILVVKRKIYPSQIIYYEGIWIIIIMTILGIGISFLKDFLTSRPNAFVSHIILGVLLGATGSYAFHITLPTLLDRSISMFVLSSLHANNLNVPELQCNFVEQFIVKSKAIEKRVKEQVVIGNIAIEDGRMQITDRGRALTSSWIRLADIFSVSKDFVEVKPRTNCDLLDSNSSSGGAY